MEVVRQLETLLVQPLRRRRSSSRRVGWRGVLFTLPAKSRHLLGGIERRLQTGSGPLHSSG
jgi:hypothetical protein